MMSKRGSGLHDEADDLAFKGATGDFTEIDHMLRLGGSRATPAQMEAAFASGVANTGDGRLVEKDGSIVTVRGEMLVYLEETAHLYEQAQMKATIFDGNLAVKHEAESGWATCTFDARENCKHVPASRITVYLEESNNCKR